PLSLSDWIPGQGDESAPRQSRENALPRLVGFGARFMAERKKDGRIGRFSFGRQLQVCRDVESGTALEDDLFDAEIAAVESAHNPRVQRCALGPVSQVAPHPLAPVLLARLETGHRRDAGYDSLPVLDQCGGLAFEVCSQRVVYIGKDR